MGKTLSPIPLAEAASWDLVAIKTRLVLLQMKQLHLVKWTFGPNVDVANDARWGRVMEGAGEDPYLGSKSLLQE
jgi:beta-glucosidase